MWVIIALAILIPFLIVSGYTTVGLWMADKSKVFVSAGIPFGVIVVRWPWLIKPYRFIKKETIRGDPASGNYCVDIRYVGSAYFCPECECMFKKNECNNGRFLMCPECEEIVLPTKRALSLYSLDGVL